MQSSIKACGLLLLFIAPVSGHAVDMVGASPSAASAFNPEIALILSGAYAHLSEDPAKYAITGFVSGGEIGPGSRGFNLAESELGIYANIDPFLYGGINVALAPDDTVAVEEAFIQTTGLGHGATLKAGRYFSAIGYLNDKHAHTWDFVDNPLAYQAFLGTQYKDEGVQLKWLAPTQGYLELGAEAGRGTNFPAAARDKNGAGAVAVFAHVGGDVGASHSWLAGVSYLKVTPQDREYTGMDVVGQTVTNAFSGASRLWIADFLWKWAPNGNFTTRNFKLQGEYFSRREDGVLAYDTSTPPRSLGPVSSAYASQQSGWYVQGLYQFMPRWRVGLRSDGLDSGTQELSRNRANLLATDYRPARTSVVLERSFSEFSRVRVQWARDRSRMDVADNQVFIQYQASLGAHGAHKF